MSVNQTVEHVTQRIIDRSRERRAAYEQLMESQQRRGVHRSELSCGNLAHGFAACGETDKNRLKLMNSANLGIISSYNDMLSAHQPFEDYPRIIKEAVQAMGSTAQFAGGFPNEPVISSDQHPVQPPINPGLQLLEATASPGAEQHEQYLKNGFCIFDQ